MRGARTAAAVAAVVAALLLAAARPARAKVIWSGDFETGDLGQWNELLNADNTKPPRVTVVGAPVRDGDHSARVEVRNTDLWSNGLNRVELGHHPDASAFEGSERAYSWSVFVPTDGAWEVREKQIAYFEADVIWKQVMSFPVRGTDVDFVARLPRDQVLWHGTGALTRGRWHDFVLRVKWAADPRIGAVELWFDGQRVLARTPVATMHRDAGGKPKANFLHVGLFRGAPPVAASVEVMYVDAAREATTPEELLRWSAAAAPPPPAPSPPSR
jgi:hypothetical protein